MLKLSVAVALSTLVTAACGAAPTPQTPASRAVTLSKSEPPAGYAKLGPLAVQSGKGCGVMGQPGSAEDAERLLRDAATKLGATYVVITHVETPRPNHQCGEHEYKLAGVAYRRSAAPAAAASPAATAATPLPPTSAAPATAPSSPPAAAPSAAAPGAGVCIPGATQACLGPGACQGAQACRDDASGFLPCDCGAPSRN